MTTTGTAPDDESTTGEGEESTGTPGTTGGTDSGSGSSDSTTGGGGNGGQACGNGIIEGSEQCDCGGDFCTPAGLGGAQCAGLTNPLFPDRHYTGGILDCNPASCQFSFNQCSWCGDGLLNGMEICEVDDEGPSCQALGAGSGTNPLPCAPTCFEWDVTCCPANPPKECL